MKEDFHIISLEPISESPTSKYFHEHSVKFVRVDMIQGGSARRNAYQRKIACEVDYHWF